MTAGDKSPDAFLAHARAMEEAKQVAVTRPGDPDPPDVLRANALAHALRDGLVISRPGAHNRPQSFAVPVDGEFRVFTAGGVPQMTVIRPETADQQIARWDYAARRKEDQILIAAFGLDECQRAGVLVTGATDAGEFAAPQLPRGVKAL